MPRPPELARIDRLAVRHETPEGVVWRCWGAGPPVILVHGGSGSWMHWVHNVEHLASDCAVWAPDLPGCGESSTPGPGTEFAGQAELTVRSWQGVANTSEPVRVVGFSLGSSVAATMARFMGTGVDRLVLIGGCFTGPHPRPRHKLLEWRGISDLGRLKKIHRRNVANMMIEDTALIDDMAVFIQGYNISSDRFERRTLSAPEAMRRALPQVTAPVIGIWGEYDSLSIPDLQMPGLAAMKPDAPQHVLPDVGHWAIYERPERFNALIAEVLR